KPSLVGYLRKWIGLVHKLAQLARTEKLLYCSHDRFGINQVMRHCTFEFGQRHLLLDGTLHAHQSYPEMVFQKFSNTAYPPVAQVVITTTSPFPFFKFKKERTNSTMSSSVRTLILRGTLRPSFS